MSQRLNGINPLSYLGVNPYTPAAQQVSRTRVPTQNDSVGFYLGDEWTVTVSPYSVWKLVNLNAGIATWVQIYPAGGGAGGASEFPCDAGTANEVGGVLNVLGDGVNVRTAGAGNTITISADQDVLDQVDTDSGSAFPQNNILRIIGGTNINTSGIANAVTINLNDSVGLLGSLSTDGSITSHTNLTVDGNSTLTGNVGIGGSLGVTGPSSLSSTLIVGGTVTLSTLGTGIVRSSGTGVISSSTGTNGQVLIGGGTAPNWANLTSMGATITITNGPNTINLEAVAGGGSSNPGFFGLLPTNWTIPYTNPGDGAPFPVYLGQNGVLTTIFNDFGGSYFPGDGADAPATFTAPVTGKYYMGMSAVGSVSPSGFGFPTPCFVYNVTQNIVYPSLAFNVSGSLSQVAIQQQAQVSTSVFLNAGDVVQFGVYFRFTSSTSALTVFGTTLAWAIPSAQFTTPPVYYNTYCYGYRVST